MLVASVRSCLCYYPFGVNVARVALTNLFLLLRLNRQDCFIKARWYLSLLAVERCSYDIVAATPADTCLNSLPLLIIVKMLE